MKFFILPFLLISSLTLSAQTESLHLQFDKTVAYPSDTLWFRGYLFTGQFVSDFRSPDQRPFNLSTNLYVELFDDSNRLVIREMFPINGSITLGQVPLPKKTGLYWLRSYTRNSSFYLTSITIRELNKAVLVRNITDEKGTPVVTDTNKLHFVTLSISEGISTTIFPAHETIYDDQPFKLVMKYYDSTTGIYPFTLIKDHQRHHLFAKDSLAGSFRGYASLLYYNSDTLVVRQDLFIPQKQVPVEMTRDSGGYKLTIKDSNSWNYSVSVSRLTGEVYPPDIMYCLAPPGKKKPTDTSFLNFRGTVRYNTRKSPLVQDKDLVVMTEKDSTNDARLINIDSAGQASLSGMYFFDTLFLHFMLNGGLPGKSDELKWTMAMPDYPAFTPPDSLHFRVDTLINIPSWEPSVLDTFKYLKAAIVKSNYADRNKAIDSRYATGRFAAPVHFSFDMTKADARHPTSILDYLVHELPAFVLPPAGAEMMKDSSIPLFPTFRRHPATFYLNEQLVNWKTLSSSGQVEIAYVKVIEDFVDDGRFIRMVSDIPPDEIATFKNPLVQDYTPSAMICIYTRNGKDLRSIPGKLNMVAIKGFDRPLRWKRPDRTTLLWVPYSTTKTYRFSLPDPGMHPFKVVMEGVDRWGYTLHFEKVVE